MREAARMAQHIALASGATHAEGQRIYHVTYHRHRATYAQSPILARGTQTWLFLRSRMICST